MQKVKPITIGPDAAKENEAASEQVAAETGAAAPSTKTGPQATVTPGTPSNGLFSFGAGTLPNTMPAASDPVKSAAAFTFGAGTASSTKAPAIASSTKSNAPAFAFGSGNALAAGNTSATAQQGSPTPFTFGSAVATSSAGAQSAPAFAFGSSGMATTSANAANSHSASALASGTVIPGPSLIPVSGVSADFSQGQIGLPSTATGANQISGGGAQFTFGSKPAESKAAFGSGFQSASAPSMLFGTPQGGAGSAGYDFCAHMAARYSSKLIIFMRE